MSHHRTDQVLALVLRTSVAITVAKVSGDGVVAAKLQRFTKDIFSHGNDFIGWIHNKILWQLDLPLVVS